LVERTIKESDDLLSRTQLWKSFPKKITYQTFKETMNYLEALNKIMYDKSGRIVWMAADDPKLVRFLGNSVRLH